MAMARSVSSHSTWRHVSKSNFQIAAQQCWSTFFGNHFAVELCHWGHSSLDYHAEAASEEAVAEEADALKAEDTGADAEARPLQGVPDKEASDPPQQEEVREEDLKLIFESTRGKGKFITALKTIWNEFKSYETTDADSKRFLKLIYGMCAKPREYKQSQDEITKQLPRGHASPDEPLGTSPKNTEEGKLG